MTSPSQPPDRPSRPQLEQVLIRMDPELHAAIKARAAADERTMAAQIRFVLKQHLAAAAAPSTPSEETVSPSQPPNRPSERCRTCGGSRWVSHEDAAFDSPGWIRCLSCTDAAAAAPSTPSESDST